MGLVGVDPLVRACPVPVQAVVGIELVVVEKDMPIELLRCQTSSDDLYFRWWKYNTIDIKIIQLIQISGLLVRIEIGFG